MKKMILSLGIISVLIACGDSGQAKKEEPKVEDITQNPDYQKGLSLLAGSDCLTCHKVDEGITGPSYKEVANKYPNADEATIKDLAGKIIKGGSGVYGTAIMTPHPAITEEDAIAMVKYILLLK